MKLCLIAPTVDLEATELAPGRFCLAHLMLNNKIYRDFWLQKQYPNTILDNGVFESESVALEPLIEIARELHPQVVILPDRINEILRKNFEAGLRSSQRFLNELPNVEQMFVLQTAAYGCEQLKHVETILDRIVSDRNIKWIGICRDFVYHVFGTVTGSKSQEFNRFVFGCWLQASGWCERLLAAGIKIHFLGMGDDHQDLLQHAWYVESIDAAGPYWKSCGFTARPTNYFDQSFRGIVRSTIDRHTLSLSLRHLQINIDAKRPEIETTNERI